MIKATESYQLTFKGGGKINTGKKLATKVATSALKKESVADKVDIKQASKAGKTIGQVFESIKKFLKIDKGSKKARYKKKIDKLFGKMSVLSEERRTILPQLRTEASSPKMTQKARDLQTDIKRVFNERRKLIRKLRVLEEPKQAKRKK